MKSFSVLLFFACIVVSSFAQVWQPVNQYNAFDTNGPVGECLFPEDDQLREVVECGKSIHEISEAVQSTLNLLNIDSQKRIKVNHLNVSSSLITFDVQLFLGSNQVAIPFVGAINKQYSEVKFQGKIEIKEGKYRITLYQFLTDRATIRGEAKSNGKSNVIHWQRINSLQKEIKEIVGNRKKLSSRKQEQVDEKERIIAIEKQIYIEEYKAVTDFMEALKTTSEIEVDDF